MTPEGKVKEKVKKILKDLGIVYFMPVQNGLGRNGVSDFICCLPDGRFLAIETKATEKDMPTALQCNFLTSIINKNGFAFVIDASNLQYAENILAKGINGTIQMWNPADVPDSFVRFLPKV